jgi:riboflavin biosynthesis pyrimidine reductase
MNTLAPLESLFDMVRGNALPLPPDLSTLYGRLGFPPHSDRAYVIGNFVTTLDGVVSLNEPGHASGGNISGFNQQDRMVMGLLRAIADVVIVGAGTLRAEPNHRWTAQYIYPALAEEYSLLRSSHGKSAYPLNVIVTASGEVNLNLPLFRSSEIPVLIVTTPRGVRSILASNVPSSVRITAVQSESSISAQDILKAVSEVHQSDMILVEGGPQLMGNFFAEHCLDELFLTLAPQIAGRDGSTERPGFVAGKSFAPEHPLWGTLMSVKRGGNHLFLRYAFKARDHA